MKKRTVKVLSVVLALVMMLSLFPVQAFAAPANRGSVTAETTWNPKLDGFGDNLGGLFDRLIDWFRGGRTPKVDPMPAVSLVSEDVEGILVTVDAPEGAFPEGTTMSTAKVDNLDAVQAAVDNTDGVSGTVLTAVDITFRNSKGREIQPAKDISVTIKSAEIVGRDDLSVVHLDVDADELGQNDVDAELVDGFSFEANTVTFDARSFSVYAVLGDDTSSNIPLLTVNFYDKNGSIINVQVIRLDKLDKYDEQGKPYVFDPGVPSIDTAQSFEGWRTDDYASGVASENLDVDKINAYIRANFNGESSSTTLNYHAMVFDVRYVVYHDQAGAILKTQAYHITGSTTESVKIDLPYVGFMGEQNFAGWITEDKVKVAGDYPLYEDNVGTIYQNGTNYDLSQTLQLYPYLNTGHWLVFDNYLDQDSDATSASYTSPVFYAEGTNTAAPATPTRTGYTFDGWYKEKSFTNRYIFGSGINEDVTVYAKWTPKNASYHVVFWVQKITDTPETPDTEKEYDFYDSDTRTALTGSEVSINTATSGTTADNRLGYNSESSIGKLGYYFLYNGNNTDTDSVTVKGDGSTVLNVYYDRKVITFKYYTDSTLSTLWTPSGGYVPAANGEYYYYEDTNAEGYYLIGTGPNADYQPSNGDTVYYYETYSSSGTWALPSFSSMTKFYTSPESDGGSHVLDTTSYDYYYFDEDHTDTWIWDAGSSYTYRYRPLFYRYTVAEPGYYRVGTGPDPTAVGTHNLSGGVGSNTVSGLYGAQLGVNDWPNPGEGNVWANDTYNYPLALTEFVPVLGEGAADTTEMKFYLTTDSGNKIHIYYVGQELNGTEYNVSLTDGESNLSTSSTTRSWYPNETIHGYTIYGYRFGTSGSWTPATVDSQIQLPTSTSGGALYVAFKRNTHSLSFFSNNEEIMPENLPDGANLNAVPFGTEFAPFQGALPTNGPEGYYFDGWYADPSCSTEFDFEAAMPDNNVRVYAKWTQMRFRVVLDPTGGEEGVEPSDITFPGNQSTTFRVDYGELVQASSINNAQREGYTLLGWFLDPAFTRPFNFSSPITDEIADMTYIYASDAERSGDDPWNINAETGNPVHYTDVGRDNVLGKVTIYAHWRQDPDGVIGINVRYNANESEDKTGHFGNTTDTVKDYDEVYADGAEAFCQPASNPDDTSLQFLYWEIMQPTSQTDPTLKPSGKKVYPGQTWDVLLSDAVEEPAKSGNPEGLYTFEQYLQGISATSGLSAFSGTNAVQPAGDPVRATHQYVKVTTPVEGKQYLITYTTGSTAYIMGNTLNSSNYINAVSATVSSNTITGDYDQYLFGVDKDSSGNYQFGNLNTIGYLGLRTTTGSGLSLTAGSSTNTWTLTANNYLSNTATTTTAGYPYIQYNTSGYFRGVDSTNTRNVITFYELQEPEITGETFDITAELKVGGKYVIAIGDYAVGNTPLNSSTNDHFIKGIRVKADTSSVTVPTADVDTATWEVVSGDAASGFILKNVGNGTYLGMSSDGECYLAATSQTLASHWTYDNGTDLNNHVEESANASGSTYFYYLSFAGAFLDFTTATYTGNNVKLYAAATTHTVTFVDGRTGETIATQQVEDGASATAPAAPDHSAQGWIFNGWDTPFDNVTADITVTALYVNQSTLEYTVTFRYMNSAGEWVSESQTVRHGDAATPPTVPTPPTGYTFNSWNKNYTSITGNITISAVYKQTATTKYVVTLRAVYGRANTTASTHIDWYANNGTGAVQHDIGLGINATMFIPTPGSFTNDTIDHTPGASKPTAGTLVYGDHVFLGWARLTEDDSRDPSQLTVEDLYLKWDPAAGKYVTTEDEDNNVAAGETATRVAADEMRPYHDMYAVWAKVFYVYHSGTNKVEQIVMTDYKKDGETRTQNLLELANMTEDGFLYGGYYTNYAGKSAGFDAKTTITWNSAISAMNQETAWTQTGRDDDGTAYNGANAVWNAETDAIKDVDGLHVNPVAGATYYIKEVPADKYLQPYLHFTYWKNEAQSIASAWLISAQDDQTYIGSGFVIAPDDEETTGAFDKATNIVSTLRVQTVNGGTSITLTPKRLFGASNSGYLSYLTVINYTNDENNIATPLLQDNDTVQQFWVTPDGLMVTGTAYRVYEGLATKTTISATQNSQPSEITLFTGFSNPESETTEP